MAFPLKKSGWNLILTKSSSIQMLIRRVREERKREKERELIYLFIVFVELNFNKIEFYVAFFQLPPWHKAYGTRF